ncbi:MAG TPA: iron ABC transporter permease [Trueperaceae bacterium]
MQRSASSDDRSFGRRRIRLGGWSIAVVAIALLVAAPILVVLSSVFAPAGDIWRHLASTLLPEYVRNSFLLMLGVGTGTMLIGVSGAWLVTMCRFPGRGLFEWALLLPLAIPAYIMAYAYTDFLQYAGPLQSGLRAVTGWGIGDYWFPDIRSLGGAILLLTLALYPYVYLLARAAFLEQAVSILEAGRSLGRSPWRAFFVVSLPLVRPAVAAGVALALMETLSDFGTVEYFGIVTFTTGIYRTWFGLGAPIAAAQLAAFLLLFILALLVLERSLGRRRRSQGGASRYRALGTFPLSGARRLLAFGACLLPILLGFLGPAAILLEMTLSDTSRSLGPDLLEYSRHTFVLAAISAVLAVLVALLLAYGKRVRPNILTRAATRIASIGYAVPGSVIAVGVLMHLGWIDNRIDTWTRSSFGFSTGLLLSGTIAGLLFAYLVRFLAMSLGAVESSLAKITPSMDEAAHSLGHRSLSTLLRVHVPLMRGSLLSAALLVFVEVTKELPATLIVRPFNFDTLAVRAYRLASDERLTEAAGGALMIVLVGIVPVFLLSRAIARSRELGDG